MSMASFSMFSPFGWRAVAVALADNRELMSDWGLSNNDFSRNRLGEGVGRTKVEGESGWEGTDSSMWMGVLRELPAALVGSLLFPFEFDVIIGSKFVDDGVGTLELVWEAIFECEERVVAVAITEVVEVWCGDMRALRLSLLIKALF